MFIDDVIADIDKSMLAQGYDKAFIKRLCLTDSLKLSHAFCITDEANEARRLMAETCKGESALAELFILPHDPIWLESNFSQDGHAGKWGVLLKSNPINMGGYTVTFIQKSSTNSGRITVETVAMFDPSKCYIKNNEFFAVSTPYTCVEAIYEKHQKDSERLLFDVSAHAIMMGITTVALINSTKVVSISDCADLSKINKMRRLRGKSPLREYRILDILPDVKKRMFHDNGDGENRLHWRRGHFKVRKTGVFWWSPHLAGNKELGMVEKDYRLCQ